MKKSKKNENRDKILQAVECILDADTKFLTRLAILCPDAVLYAKDGESIDAEIIALYAQGNRINAIKLCREKKDVGLKEAKEYCDKIAHYRSYY